MRIAIDAMGGDRAPAAPVAGGVAALAEHTDVELTLVGDVARIEAELDALDAPAATRGRVVVHDAPEVAGGGDPVKAIRASEKVSARACAELLRAGSVDGVVTMGNTGAAVAAATLYCKRLAGVKRLGIAVPFPRADGATVVIDAGANPDARPEHLRQYAIMAAQYARHALGVSAPRVGILSIGEEEYKGNRTVADTWALFREHPVEGFIGNVEPREFFEDRADVVVSDGFTGNVALKAAEGMAELLLGMLPDVLGSEHAGLVTPIAGGIAQRVDYAKYGGAPLLGVDGGYLIGHGRSGAEAFQSAVGVIRSYVTHDVGHRIVEALAHVPQGEGA